MAEQSPKRAVLEHLAGVARALGSSHRLELLELLAQRERSVEVLAKLSGLSIASVSQHLQTLRRAGLVRASRQGRHVVYSLASHEVVLLLSSLRQVAENNVDALERVLNAYFRKRDNLEPVSRNELLRRIKRGTVTVIDIRPREEFEAGHLPGAINLPLAELRKRLHELPRDQEIVAYCRGPYCLLSYEAVSELRKHGFRAFRMEDGFPEWKAAGMPIEGVSTANA